MATYFKDPPQLVFELMQKTFGNSYTYFLESPTMIAEAAYPCIIVESSTSNNTIKGAMTGVDNVSEQINIYLFVNSKDQAGASDMQFTSKRLLYQTVQGRDPATGFYLPQSIMYALRTNISLFNTETSQPTTIDQDIDINYDVIERRSDQPALLGAIVSIVTREHVMIQTRV